MQKDFKKYKNNYSFLFFKALPGRKNKACNNVCRESIFVMLYYIFPFE